MSVPIPEAAQQERDFLWQPSPEALDRIITAATKRGPGGKKRPPDRPLDRGWLGSDLSNVWLVIRAFVNSKAEFSLTLRLPDRSFCDWFAGEVLAAVYERHFRPVSVTLSGPCIKFIMQAAQEMGVPIKRHTVRAALQHRRTIAAKARD